MRGGLKLKPAADYLGGLSIPTMHRLIRRGLLTPNRSLRHLIIPVTELERFLRQGQLNPSTSDGHFKRGKSRFPVTQPPTQ
jgi:hypothetical protein